MERGEQADGTRFARQLKSAADCAILAAEKEGES